MLQEHIVAFSMSLAISITGSAVVTTTFLDAFLSREEVGQQKQLITYGSRTKRATLACSCAMYVLVDEKLARVHMHAHFKRGFLFEVMLTAVSSSDLF
jgi:hypothetical protein